ncbi:MAG: tRNA pseudouridine(55) synthase TruB [Oscillospiraceae bacterium]|nr:tRNA pseudouridine(55) synthase TruB [Oscillospiraceae bacterium]
MIIKKNNNYNGILCVDKPAGFTSFDVIAKLRGILHMKRLGHAGTLDPMATGVLPVFVGYATKACHILPDESKTYLAGFQLGQTSDTQDATGTILETRDFFGISQQDILKAIPSGNIMQIPPMYSAVSVNGKRLYELARAGKEIERPAKQVSVNILSFPEFDPVSGMGIIEIHCSKGTYIRTILHDMGQNLGCGAMMTSLRRTAAGGFTLNNCHTLEEIQELANPNQEQDQIPEILKSLAEVFQDLPRIQLNKSQTKLYRNGVKLSLSELNIPETESKQYAVYGTISGGFLGIAVTDPEQHCLRVFRNLCPPDEVQT